MENKGIMAALSLVAILSGCGGDSDSNSDTNGGYIPPVVDPEPELDLVIACETQGCTLENVALEVSELKVSTNQIILKKSASINL